MVIPQIWANALLDSIQRCSIMVDQWRKEEQARHEERMATDPDYASAYELRQAEDAAMSYWDALYDNQLLEMEEDEW